MTLNVFNNALGRFNETMQYDAMGNLVTCARHGQLSGSDVTLNNLTYNYSNSGNKLASVADGGAAPVSSAYTYDANGNQITDSGKGITINYDDSNLPLTITKGTTQLQYIYDRQGTKLATILTTPTSYARRDYMGELELVTSSSTGPSKVDFIHTEEGRVRYLGSTGNVYEYYMKDHLGNTRLAFMVNNGVRNTTQVQDYYPFGSSIPGSSNALEQDYKYNSKEQQQITSLYDYGARFYDPVIGRFTTVDPLAEKMRRYSPYTYGDDNPIRNIDPDGMETQDCCVVPKWAKDSYNSALATTKSAFNQTATAVVKAADATQKWTVEHKGALLNTAKAMQDAGDKTVAAGSVMAIAGAPVAGVGAAPGVAVATTGAIVSTAGTVLEVAVDFVTGSNKNGSITVGNDLGNRALDALGNRAVNDLFPEAPAVNFAAKQGVKLLNFVTKSQTDKVVEGVKNKDK